MKKVIMPRLSEASDEGDVVEWLKEEGEKVEKGEPLVLIESEKASAEVEAPVSGILHAIIVPKGTARVGDVLAVIAESGEELPPIEEIVKPKKPPIEVKKEEMIPRVKEVRERVKATPAARRLGKEYDIDLTQVTGTGHLGTIARGDVENFIEKKKALLVEKEIVPITGFRKIMAERLLQSVRTYAPIMAVWEMDMSELLKLRRKLKSMQEKQGVRVTVTALLIKAVAQALKENIIFNSAVKNGNIVIRKRINVGVAVAVEGESFLEDKLLVPVVKDADRKSLVEIAQTLEELTKKAREGTLAIDDMTGATITVSNPGAGAPVVVVTQLIPPDQSAIIGFTSIIERPVARDGKIEIRPTMNATLTYDHRIIVPTHSFKFRRRITELIENPLPLLT